MADEADDLDTMSLDQLRKLRDEVLMNIEAVGSQSADVNPDGPEQIKNLDAILADVELRISKYAQDAG